MKKLVRHNLERLHQDTSSGKRCKQILCANKSFIVWGGGLALDKTGRGRRGTLIFCDRDT